MAKREQKPQTSLNPFGVILRRLLYCDLVAASAWARRLAEVEPPWKKRPKAGWTKELKTIWAPLLMFVRSLPGGNLVCGVFRVAYLVWGRDIQRIRTNLKM